MARRIGGSHKCVEEKRRMLPIYQHYTLSPGRTKSHHPEAKCNHCLKEFVCGSKQRLIRHLRKCNSITNPEQIIAETLNTLARNSATGQLNHSILEASNLLPSQITHIHHSTNQQLVGQAIQQQHYHPHSHHPHLQHHPNNNHSASNSTTTANRNLNSTNSSVTSVSTDSTLNGTINHNTSGSSLANNDSMIVASPSNNSTTFGGIIPVKKTRRGRRPGSQHGTGSGIHVTTGLDGKTQFTPISQLPPGIIGSSPQLITPLHNGGTRGGATYATYHHQASSTQAGLGTATAAPGSVVPPGVALNSGHHHLHVTPFKLNSEPIDKAYLKLVLTRNLPLSLCDTKEFQNWVRTLANDYKPPSSINLIAHNLKQEAQLAKQKVSNILVKAPKKTVNLELHCWPDQLRGHLWYAIIAALDSWRFLISIKDALEQVNSFGHNTAATTTTTNDNNNINHSSNDISICQLSNGPPSSSQTDPKILSEFIDDCIKRVGSDRVNGLMFTGKMITELAIVKSARQALYTNHPSIVTYYCWWHFTNLLSSDVVENNESSLRLLKNSNSLINYITKRPQLYLKIERFSPFAGATGSLNLEKDDPRWYSQLVCYLVEFIKNNYEAILKALEEYYPTAETTRLISVLSDNNNNSANDSADSTQATSGQQNGGNTNSLTGTQLSKQNLLQREQAQLAEMRSNILSNDFTTTLDSISVYLKPFRDIVALISNNADAADQTPRITSAISTTLSNHLSLSDYMNWFLNYGRTLFNSWHQSPDQYKYNIIGKYVRRFNNSISDFKLLFAAYLLNPKYRCAYVTQKAKGLAIEEILNIASEFMPEESDGHTIFDQWRLYLVREEPYDMVYDENRSSALDWWMSLPCAESIRRVALRILRLKAFSSPKPESIFSQLNFFEDETKTSLGKSSHEDLAILRYFYDHEDRLSIQNSAHTNGAHVLNGVPDRTQVGQAHNEHLHEANDPEKYLPSGGLVSSETSDEHSFTNDSLTINEGGDLRIFSDVGGTYMEAPRIVEHINSSNNASNLALENLAGFERFAEYIDFNESGIQVVEEPIEKKRRKWTAQEILSKCQSNHNNSGVTANNKDANIKLNEK